MNPIETILYTVARPVQGVFPTDQIAQALQKSLVQIEKLIPDWTQTMRDAHEEAKALGEITERGYNLRMAETNRNQKESGDTPIMEIQGVDADGFRLRFRFSETFLTAGFMEKADMSNEKAHLALPKIKSLISQVCPEVTFKDVVG